MNQISLSFLANFNSAVPWGLWVSIYVWLVGISCGAYAIVMWANLTNNAEAKKLTRIGVMLALSTLMVGLLSILIDLGHMERFYKLFISPSPSSVMACVVWMYNIYFILLAAVILFWLKSGTPRTIAQFSVIYAVLLIVMEGLLFARPAGKAWHSPLFITHFITSSLVAGAGALILVTAVFWKQDGKGGQLRALAKIALPIVLLSLVVETVEIFARGTMAHMESLFMFLAAVAIAALLWNARPAAITIAGVISLISTLGVKYRSLISAQIAAPYRGFENAYIEPKLAFNYFPTLPEVSIAAALIALAAVIFYILYKLFPLTREG